MRAIDADRLCVDLMERWDIADKQKEELVKQVMADIVTPIVVSQPTIEPERKKGEWIDAVLPNDNGGLPVQVCDQCNTFFPLAYTGGGHRFCPSCGADMREDNND